MNRLRVYVDTSVFGGCFDEELEEASRRLFDAVSAGETIMPLFSETLARELEGAPEEVCGLFRKACEGEWEQIEVSAEAVRLARAYVAGGVLAETYADDALHVALATLARADVIVSWNFRHLVNPVRIRAFGGVNVAHGYGPVVILTPADIVALLEGQDESEA